MSRLDWSMPRLGGQRRPLTLSLLPNCLPERAHRVGARDDGTTYKRLRSDDGWRPSGSLADEDPVWGDHG